MKKLLFLTAFLAFFSVTKAQPVGIGTATPDDKAILDIVSTGKGVLIPRIVDTANVTNPVEGMIIYNKNTKTPYYYDGKQWVSMGSMSQLSLSSSTGRITYSITGSGYNSQADTVLTLTQEVTNEGYINGVVPKSQFADFSFTKPKDINSRSFNMSATIPALLPSIEIKVYAAGAANPYISFRLLNIIIKSFTSTGPAAGNPYYETIAFSFENYGFRDWVHNVSFGYNVKTGTVSAY
jgi:type VI protein secretion system component Hcp